MKKVLSVIFTVMLLALCMMPLTASAAVMTDPDYIYFEIPTEGVVWKNFNMIYCHMWSKNGGDVYAWQDKNEVCEDLGNGYWRYDLSEIDFDPEGEYSLIFSNEIGMQTYNLNITSACRGDIAFCNGDTCVNPIDGEKTCAVARWKHNGEKVHPAIEVDSNGAVLNVDEVDTDGIDTVWGSDEGTAQELPEITVAVTDETVSEDVDSPADVSVSAVTNADGINTNVATVWIIAVCALVICAIITVVIILAKKNKNNK